MQYLFLALFFLFSTIHLADSWRSDQRARARTKPFLLLFLIGFYLTAAERISWVLLAALITSWLGDVLLIPKGHRWFLIGGSSFLLSHFFFIGVYVEVIRFDLVSWWIVAPLAAVYTAISLMIIRAVRPTTPKAMVVPMYLYLLANSAMNLFALMQLMTLACFGAWIAFLGAVLFFASDCVLFLVRYYRNPDVIFRRHFTVMLAYLLGEWMITLGSLLLGG